MLYKRSKKARAHWWVRFEIKGHEIRQSSGTDSKERAQTFERELRNAVWDEENLGIEIHTWEEACERWLKEKAHKRSIQRDRQAIKRVDVGPSTELSRIDPAAVGSELPGRERAVLRSILNACVRWGWLDKAPKVEMPHEEKHEPRWITKEQFDKLCKELPPHATTIVRFGVATGLRQSNIFGLRWNAVDLGQQVVHIRGAESKTRKAMGIPLSKSAQDVLAIQRGKHEIFVFTDHKGRAPITSIKTCWAKATKRAGLEGFRFHDLRHTWAAWHTLSGTPPIILKELGGWASLQMVERYSALNPGHLADWADNSRTKAGTDRKRVKRKRL